MFKKIIAYVGICLCVVLCFGMFFIKPVKAQVISTGTPVVSQFFPSSIICPNASLLGLTATISLPVEKTYSEIDNDFSYLGNTIVYSHENIDNDLAKGTISYVASFDSPLFYQTLLMHYYSSMCLVIDDVDITNSVILQEYVVKYENMVVPLLNNVGSLPLDEEFSILLNRSAFGSLSSLEYVDLSIDEFVCENFQFDIVARDTNGSTFRETHYINDISSSNVVYFEKDIDIPFSCSVYYLGNIINEAIYDTIDLSNFIYGNDYVYLDNFQFTIRVYDNDSIGLYANSQTALYPTFTFSLPLIPIDSDYDYYKIENFLSVSNGFSFSQQEIEPVDTASWLISSVGAFMNAELFPGFAIGGIFAVMVAFPLVIWFLKIVLGG